VVKYHTTMNDVKIFVRPGAPRYLGDAHAAMGDGEIASAAMK
jgi:acetamidase/formamidase